MRNVDEAEARHGPHQHLTNSIGNRKNEREEQDLRSRAEEKLQGRTVNACGVKCRRRTRYTAKSSGEVCAAD
jgi:hypothetical protein